MYSKKNNWQDAIQRVSQMEFFNQNEQLLFVFILLILWKCIKWYYAYVRWNTAKMTMLKVALYTLRWAYKIEYFFKSCMTFDIN